VIFDAVSGAVLSAASGPARLRMDRKVGLGGLVAGGATRGLQDSH
jgi:hypothetical protein